MGVSVLLLVVIVGMAGPPGVGIAVEVLHLAVEALAILLLAGLVLTRVTQDLLHLASIQLDPPQRVGQNI